MVDRGGELMADAAVVHIKVADIPALRPFLEAVGAVAAQWEQMSRCYSGSEENVALAELLDTLTDAVRNLGGER